MYYFFQVIFKVCFFNCLFGWIVPPPIVTFTKCTCDCRVLRVNGGIYLQQQQQHGCSVHLTYTLFRRESRR